MAYPYFSNYTIIKDFGPLDTVTDETYSANTFGIVDHIHIKNIGYKDFYRLTLSNGRFVDCNKFMYTLVVNRNGIQKKVVNHLSSSDLLFSIVNLDYEPYHEVSPINKLLREYVYNKDGIKFPDNLVFSIFPKIRTFGSNYEIDCCKVSTNNTPYIIANGILMRTRAKR